MVTPNTCKKAPKTRNNIVSPDIAGVERNPRQAERRGEEIIEVEGEATHSEKTFETEITLSGAETLEGNSSHEWTGVLSIPSGQMPIYMGRNAKQEWSVFAGLDCFGNDPDAGWQTIVVKEQNVE